MTEENRGHTATLLPAARIKLFTRDSQTKESFLALAGDWRFARVELEAHEGDADTAVSMFQATASPDLVIVQTEDINAAFSEKLEQLGGVCAEGTAAIVIGPVNDVDLYRRLVGMGVSDYLVRPVQTEALANNIAETLIEKLGAGGSRLIAMMGAKGGVGVTVLSSALAWGISDILGQKTFLLDAAGGWSTLNVGMNFEPSTTLAEAVRAAAEGNTDSFTRMLHHAGEKLTVLSSGGDVMLDDPVDAAGYEALLDMLMTTYPVLLVDLSAASAALKRTVLSRAHEIVLVTAPTLPSVRATRTLLHEIRDIRGGSDAEVDIAVNMIGMAPKNEVPKAQIEEGLDRKVDVFIPYDAALFIGVEGEGRKLGDDKSGAPIVERLLPLARDVLVDGSAPGGVAEQEKSKKGGLEKLLSRIRSK